MMMKTRLGRSIAAAAVAVLALVVAGTSSAQVYRMQGGWVQQRGETNIPAWIVPLGALNEILLGLDGPTIPGDAFVTVTPASGPGGPAAAIQMPAGAFKLLNNSRAIPLQQALESAFGPGNGGNTVQLTTTFEFSGPGTAAVLQAEATNIRLTDDFSYCPGAISNPNCPTAVQGGNDGTLPGRVRYTAGPNRYGATMGMLIQGGGSVSVSLGPVTTPRLRVDVIAGAGSQEIGLGYQFVSSVVLQEGKVYSTFMQTPFGLISALGATTDTLTPDTNINTGFPWTTGMVIASEPGGATSMDNPYTITVTGSDNRTPGGRGTLSLVAGGLSHRLASGQSFVSGDKITMGIAAGTLTPALSPTGVAAVASLLLIGGGYVLRKRL